MNPRIANLANEKWQRNASENAYKPHWAVVIAKNDPEYQKRLFRVCMGLFLHFLGSDGFGIFPTEAVFRVLVPRQRLRKALESSDTRQCVIRAHPGPIRWR